MARELCRGAESYRRVALGRRGGQGSTAYVRDDDPVTRWPKADGQTPTVLEHIRAHLHPSGCGLLPGGSPLPGAESAAHDSRWSPRPMARALPEQVGAAPKEPAIAVDEIRSLLVGAVQGNGRDDAFAALYDRIRSLRVLWYVGPLLDALSATDISVERLHRIAHKLAAEGRHVDPVKVGIALLSLCPGFDDRDLLLTLGRSDELTLYCAITVVNTEADPEPVLWSLARSVTGWGRIHTVRMLAETQNPEIQDWIVRDGFRNNAAEWMLTTTAATTGRLLERLQGDPDDDLVKSAADLVSLQVQGGWPQGLPIDEYPRAPDLLQAVLGVIEDRPHLLHFVVLVIEELLQEEDDDDAWEDRYDEGGWTPQRRIELLATCERITSQPRWRTFVESRLESDDWWEFTMAVRAAADLGLDSFPAQWRRVQRDPLNGSWHTLMPLVDESRLDQVIDLALREFPLEEMTRGPLPMPPHGIGWRAHRHLQSIVDGLARFPGRGWPLVSAALRTPDDGARHAAVRTLSAWPRAAWPAEAAPALHAAARAETVEVLRARMRAALDDE